MLDALLFSKTPKVLTQLYPKCLWRVNTQEKKLYLTFDDGPIAEITPFVLDELKKWNAKATFFCIGKNVDEHNNIFSRIIAEGHTVGNHTYNHLNGWNNDNELYFQNIEKCEFALNLKSEARNVKLFRPPYGKLTPSQYTALNTSYRVVMWDVLSYDFDLSITKEQVFENIRRNATSGSIIVMHDSLKAKPKLEYALPKMLAHFSSQGFMFDALC